MKLLTKAIRTGWLFCWNSKMTVLIFANGEIEELEWIRPFLANATAVIAADGGTHHLMRLDHLPDLVIGDMDSLSVAAREWLEKGDVPLQTYPTAKDETDLELALLVAMQEFEESILLFGVLGGRLDQTLANILLLTHPALRGRHVQLLTQRERAWLVNGRSQITGHVGDTISFIPLGGDVKVKNSSGLRWPLQNEILSFGLARGVSNVLVERQAMIEIEDGFLLCVHMKDEG